MAVVAVAMAVTIPPLGIVFGHVARGQIQKSGEDGDGLALGGLVVGYILTGLIAAFCVVGFTASMLSSSS